MMATSSIETSGSPQPTAQRHIPDAQAYRCDNLKIRMQINVKTEFPLHTERVWNADAWLNHPVLKHSQVGQTGFAHAPSFVAKSETSHTRLPYGSGSNAYLAGTKRITRKRSVEAAIAGYNTVRRMRSACSITSLQYRHTLQIPNICCFSAADWLHESTSMVRYTHINCFLMREMTCVYCAVRTESCVCVCVYIYNIYYIYISYIYIYIYIYIKAGPSGRAV